LKKINEKKSPAKSGGMMYSDQIVEKSEIPKSGRTTSEEANLDKERYYTAEYFSHAQFISFSEQMRLVHSLNRKDILEIGIGNGIVADFLRKAGLNVTTFDINPNLSPDVVGSVTDLIDIFQHRKFDLILCAEVLEHMPFERFEQAIDNIAETTNEYAILTLPRCQKVIFDIQFNIKIPKLPYIEKGLFLSIPNSNINTEHHWELNSSKETKLKEINTILKKNFTILDSSKFSFRSYHHYFILKKHTL
jgi:hypothetical protein